jgi:hypothetical protein
MVKGIPQGVRVRMDRGRVNDHIFLMSLALSELGFSMKAVPGLLCSWGGDHEFVIFIVRGHFNCVVSPIII